MRTDAELIRAARVDAKAFGELYQRHARAIARWHATRAPARLAGELTAETFAQASLSLHRFRDDADGSAAPWLYGIARNVLRRTLDRERVETAARRRLGMSIQAYEADLDAARETPTASTAESTGSSRLGDPLDAVRQAAGAMRDTQRQGSSSPAYASPHGPCPVARAARSRRSVRSPPC